MTKAKTIGERLPDRLHHYASVVKDQEAARHLMEDILGIPLVATWAEKATFHDADGEQEYCHTFYELEGGGAIAFFQFADPKMYELCQAELPAKIDRFHHLAVRVDDERFEDLKRRMVKAGIQHRERDHGYCRSLYMVSEDGLQLEFTADVHNVDELNAEQRVTAHDTLARWLAGDHTPNNDIRH